MARDIEALLNRLLADAGITATLTSRVKTVESMLAKVDRPDKSYTSPLSELTDLLGIRVVVSSVDDVELVDAMCRREFEVDETNSVDKGDALGSDRMGYRSVQIIASLTVSRRGQREWAYAGGQRFEIQIRTQLQHAWAEVDHALAYKGPLNQAADFRRRLNLVAASLELADSELAALQREGRKRIEEARREVKVDPRTISLVDTALEAFVYESEDVARLSDIARVYGVTVGPAGSSLARDVAMCRFVGLATVSDLQAVHRAARDWDEELLRQFLENSKSAYGASISAMDRNGLTTLVLIASFPGELNERRLEGDFGFGQAWRALRAASSARGRSDGV